MSWARFCGLFHVPLEEGSLPALSGVTVDVCCVLTREPAAPGGRWALELWLGQGRRGNLSVVQS